MGGLVSTNLVDNSPPPFLMGGLLSVNLADNSPPLVYVVLHHRTWPGQIILFLICTVYLILTAECWAGMEATA